MLKRASSRRMRGKCWERVEVRLWGTAFWSGGGSASTGKGGPPWARPSDTAFRRARRSIGPRLGLRSIRRTNGQTGDDEPVHGITLKDEALNSLV